MRSVAAKRNAEAPGEHAAERNNNSCQQRNRNGPPPPSQRRGSRRQPTAEGAQRPRRPPRSTYLEPNRQPPPSRQASPTRTPALQMPQLIDRIDRLSVNNSHSTTRTERLTEYQRSFSHSRNRGVRQATDCLKETMSFYKIPPAASSSNHHRRGDHRRMPTSSSSGNRQQMTSSRRNPLQLTNRPNRHVVPPNEAHMRQLNDQLRQFSYGNEDMYLEVPMPSPELPKTAPRVPRNKMYVFTKRTVFDEKGRQLETKTINQIVDVESSHVVIIDDYDDLEL